MGKLICYYLVLRRSLYSFFHGLFNEKKYIINTAISNKSKYHLNAEDGVTSYLIAFKIYILPQMSFRRSIHMWDKVRQGWTSFHQLPIDKRQLTGFEP
jgi:hypothetical protein